MPCGSIWWPRRGRLRRGHAGRAEVHLVCRPRLSLGGANGGLVFFAYCTNYLIDRKHAVIVDVEAPTAVRQAEVTAQRRMIDRTQERFGLWPERLAADAGYGSAENLAWLVHERDVEPHIPVLDKSRRTDGIFSRDDFTYDHNSIGGKATSNLHRQIGRSACRRRTVSKLSPVLESPRHARQRLVPWSPTAVVIDRTSG